MRERDPFNEHFRRMEVYLRNKKFGIDIDGTSADTAVPVAAEVNKILNCNPAFRPQDIDGWHAIRDFAKVQGLSDEDAQALDRKLWFTPEILNQALPVAGAGSLLYRMQLYCEAPPLYISSREPQMLPHTRRWFECLPWVDNKSQIHIREDLAVEGKVFKAQKVVEHGITHFLDDSLEHAEYLLEHTDVHVILLPYGKTPCDLAHPRLTVIKNTEMQSLWPVYKMITKGHIPTGTIAA